MKKINNLLLFPQNVTSCVRSVIVRVSFQHILPTGIQSTTFNLMFLAANTVFVLSTYLILNTIHPSYCFILQTLSSSSNSTSQKTQIDLITKTSNINVVRSSCRVSVVFARF